MWGLWGFRVFSFWGFRRRGAIAVPARFAIALGERIEIPLPMALTLLKVGGSLVPFSSF